MDEMYSIARFDGAVQLLPGELRQRARRLLSRERSLAEEFRLRRGQVPTVLLPEGEVPLGGEPVTGAELEALLERATSASFHTVQDSLRRGYVTVRGGYRLGLCGTAVTEEGCMTGLRSLSSAALRISREVRGVGEQVLDRICPGGSFASTLILSPPGGGKTTLLRDLIRLLSDRKQLRVAAADERGEIAAMWQGERGMDVGRYTDVLEGCSKAEGAMALLRAMNPQVLAMDEITQPEDVEAMLQASYCGVQLLATAHAASFADLQRRGLYRQVLESGMFRYGIFVERRGALRQYRVEVLP